MKIKIFFYLSVMGLFSCISNNLNSIAIVKEEGWINDTTFSAAAYASSNSQTSSKQIALQKARKKIIKQFISIKKKQYTNNQLSQIDSAQRKYDTKNINAIPR